MEVVKPAKDLQSTRKSNRSDYSSNKGSYKNSDYKFSGKKDKLKIWLMKWVARANKKGYKKLER